MNTFNKGLNLIGWFAGWLGLCAVAYAQPGAYERETYYEGMIHYSFRVEGPIALGYREANPIDNMRWFFKDGDYMIHIYGPKSNDPLNPVSAFETTRLFLADSNHLYVIDARNERAFKYEKYEPVDSIIPTAFPTGDSIRILNYMCYGYRVNKEDGTTITYYITPKIKVNMAYFPEETTNSRGAWQTKGLQGCIPLMTIKEHPKKMKITIKAQTVTPMKIEKDQLQIPSFWKVINGVDYRRLGLY
jgi:hypothetical protein